MSIVVVSDGDSPVTACLAALAESESGSPYDVTLVSAGPSDESLTAVKGLKLIEAQADASWAALCKAGAEASEGELAAIEKAVRSSDLGLNPVVDSELIRLPIPPLTQERRKELVKLIKKMTEEARVAVRAARRDGNDLLKAAEDLFK